MGKIFLILEYKLSDLSFGSGVGCRLNKTNFVFLTEMRKPH